MKKKFLLFSLLALALTINAQNVSVDDFCGTFTESVDDKGPYNVDEDYSVTIEKVSDNTVSLSGFNGFQQAITGTVDLAARTITIAGGTDVSYYKLGACVDLNKDDMSDVVIQFAEDMQTAFCASWGFVFPSRDALYFGGTITYTRLKEISIDDFCGTFTESVDDKGPYNVDEDYSVTIEKASDNTVTLSGFNGFQQAITGTVDLAARTITIAGGTDVSYYKLGACVDLNKDDMSDVVIQFAEDMQTAFCASWGFVFPSRDALYFGGTITYTRSNETDGIVAVSTKKADGKVYNLAGQLVDSHTKGLVIKNGKKYIVK